MKGKTKKHWYERWLVYTLASIIAFIVIPYLINTAFKATSPHQCLIAEWNAGDALAFYGTVLGAFVTVIALVTTIFFTNQQNRKSELFQRNMIIADNKKVLLDDKYEKIITWINKVRAVVLLEVLEDDNLWDKLFDRALNSFPEKIIECYKYLCTQEGLKDGIEKRFYKESIIIITSIITELYNLSERIEMAEGKIKIYNYHKEQFEQEFSKFENKLKRLQQAANQQTDNNNGFNEEKPKSTEKLYEEFINELNQNKENYKDDYISLFDEYIEFKKNEKLQQIKQLYEF